jgi:hypothetical protein
MWKEACRLGGEPFFNVKGIGTATKDIQTALDE